MLTCPLPRAALAAALCLSLSAPLAAHEYAKGAPSIVHPHARATPKEATTGAGHVRIVHKADTPDRLISVASPVAARVELHQTVRDGSMFRMRPMPGGIAVPERGKVELAPGGYPIMRAGLKRPLREGQAFGASFRFEKAREVPVVFLVDSAAAEGTHHDH